MRIFILASILTWSIFACAHDQIQPCPKDLQAKADQAYLEYFPLLENARAYQACGMGLAFGKAHPTNAINHNNQLLDHTFVTVVGPNNDTLYSEWTLDLSAGPVYIEMPYIDPAKRYSSILILDSMHYEVGVTVNPSGKIMFVRSGTKYNVPKDVSEVYKFNSDLNMILHRTEVIDNNDLDDVIALQKEMKITAPIHRNMEEIYPPMDADFVTRANSLLSGTTLSEANAKNAECYKEIGILSDKKIDRSILDKAVENGQAWMKANESKFDTAYFNSEENAPKKNHQTGRALANYVWHLAFQPKHADYPNIEFDTEGKRLHGDNVYTLTFDKDLPVNAFWSMTTYILKTKHFVPNDEKLYKVGDKTAVLNPDGETITITYSATRPENVTNWQPTPKGKEFYIGVRLYEAKKEWLDGKYKLPVPVKVTNTPDRIEATVAEMHAYKVVHHANYLKTTAKQAGGTNVLLHTKALPTEGKDPVVTPALDHLYSKAVIDLSKGPVVLEVPKVEKDRYFSIMVTDQEHYVNYDMIRPVGKYIFIKEGWKGEIPDGATVIENRSTYPHLFVRTQVKTPDDLKNALAIQNKAKLTGTVGTLDFTDPVQFTIDTHNVHTKNAGLLASLAGKYTAEDHARMQNFMTQEYIKRSAAEGANNIGIFGSIDSKEARSDDPLTRLLGIVGHLGLPVKSATMKGKTHAYYTGVVTNCDGEILNGSKPEVFTFPYEPGVDEFWSITRYHGVTYNTIPGAQDVYNAYNTKPDADGNITITFSAKDPKDGTYWMPVIEGEPYYFIERFYGPRMDKITTVLDRCKK